ncbi:MAG: DUF1802 family protein [Candidatus Methylomirabilales bacterium]
MPVQAASRVALKEWAIVTWALEQGRQVLLLRKGGIADRGGVFEVMHGEFALYPTFLHQEKRYLRPEFHAELDRIVAESRMDRVRVTSYAVVEAVVEVRGPEALRKLDPYHVWTPAYLDLRFAYKATHPLYILLLRTYRLPRPVEFVETKAYAGCKSWVTLDFEIGTQGAIPVLTETEMRDRIETVRSILQLS